jgi:L-fuculose-phosphate aldolase
MDDLAAKMCEIGRRAYQRELVDGTGGNFSCRLDDRRVLCTPTLLCKGLLAPHDLCLVDLDGHQVTGARKPSSEILMHLEIYAASPAVQAVIHCHPPFATTFAVLGQTIPTGVLPEGDVFLGPVPLIPYQTPATRDMGAALRPYLTNHVAALLQNHGTVTWGPDLETAYVLTETLEAVCRVVFQARQLGEVQRISAEQQSKLAEIRARLRGNLV